MRRLRPRPKLSAAVIRRLAAKTQEILAQPAGKPRGEFARKCYKSARAAKWFEEIVKSLRTLAGEGDLCMYCSANESSETEHFRPLSIFPKQALEYRNYLWSCGICNRQYKQDRFPPITEPGAEILNPLDDDVWEYFFLDEKFGRLIPRIDPATGEKLPRAKSTVDVVAIDREGLQSRRLKIFRRLKAWAVEANAKLAAGADAEALRPELAEWRAEPFQGDVADYFLNGPGRQVEPFRTLLEALADPDPRRTE